MKMSMHFDDGLLSKSLICVGQPFTGLGSPPPHVLFCSYIRDLMLIINTRIWLLIGLCLLSAGWWLYVVLVSETAIPCFEYARRRFSNFGHWVYSMMLCNDKYSLTP